MKSPIKEVESLGQSIWLDFISRGLIYSGQLKRLVDDGLLGMTSNPTIFHKAITAGSDYDGPIRDIIKFDPEISTNGLYDKLIIQDIQMAADLLRPVYDVTGGVDGLVSLEPPAQLANDTAATMSEVRRLWQLVKRPNVMMKVPATPEGIPAVEELLAQGININITLMFSMKHYEAVSQAYLRGITRSPNAHSIASVASFFVSRVDTYVDKELEKIGTATALALRGKAAVANSRLVYRRFREVFAGKEFAALQARGGRVQRLLWGSTSTKNPAYSDVKYVEELIGPDTINTLPIETLEAFRDHGKVRRTIDEGVEEAERALAGLKDVGVDLDAVTGQLQKDGVKAFVDSLDQLLQALEEKRKAMVG
ncbi:MAG: transaldolase [Chloroflexi bacterium RBG_16_57_8]|nr:MAG: transaldolase [Chloroflexi bacterium RBG_16_57_8]